MGAVLGQRTVDTRVHAESCEPNISSLKQTKDHHCEGIGLYEGVGVEDVEEGERHQLEATGSSLLRLAHPPSRSPHIGKYSNVGRLFCTQAPPKFTKKLAVDSFFNFGS